LPEGMIQITHIQTHAYVCMLTDAHTHTHARMYAVREAGKETMLRPMAIYRSHLYM